MLAEFYAERLGGALADMPVDRAILTLFGELVRGAGVGVRVGDIGCGTGHLSPFLAAQGMSVAGVDMSPEMIRVARRDHPDATYEIGDLRALPFADNSLAGVVCWYSLMYLAPGQRAAAFAELARVLRPGGVLTTAWKVGDGSLRRTGSALGLGVEFDIYWLEPERMEQLLTDAGFRIILAAQRPAGPQDDQPQGYLVAQQPS